MKPPELPELAVMWSPSIDTELLFDARELTPSPNDLPPLANRLGLKTPSSLTAALLRRGEQQLQLEPHFSDRLDPENASQELHPPDALRVYVVGKLSERSILEGFAHALVVQVQFKRRMNVIGWGGAAAIAEMGTGTIILQTGSAWGLLGYPLAGATIAGLGLWMRGQRNTYPVMPSLDGLRSPVRITGPK